MKFKFVSQLKTPAYWNLANYQHFTEPEQILPIRQLQIEDLVGNLSASLLPPNKFYV